MVRGALYGNLLASTFFCPPLPIATGLPICLQAMGPMAWSLSTETSPLKRPFLRFPYWPAPAPPLCRCCRRVPPENDSPATAPRIPQTVGAQGLEAAREGSVCTMFHCSVRYYTYVMVPPASPREREYHNKGVLFPGGTPEQRNTAPQRASGKTQRAARRPTASRSSMPAAYC